ncbi:MAG: hypothetical protein QM811_10190 [Pirellulales bacterium]
MVTIDAKFGSAIAKPSKSSEATNIVHATSALTKKLRNTNITISNVVVPSV